MRDRAIATVTFTGAAAQRADYLVTTAHHSGNGFDLHTDPVYYLKIVQLAVKPVTVEQRDVRDALHDPVASRHKSLVVRGYRGNLAVGRR